MPCGVHLCRLHRQREVCSCHLMLNGTQQCARTKKMPTRVSFMLMQTQTSSHPQSERRLLQTLANKYGIKTTYDALACAQILCTCWAVRILWRCTTAGVNRKYEKRAHRLLSRLARVKDDKRSRRVLYGLVVKVRTLLFACLCVNSSRGVYIHFDG